VIAIVVSNATLGWLVFIQVWILLLWYQRGRSPFPRRLDQLLALLVPESGPTRNPLTSTPGRATITALLGPGRLGGLRGSARRWRSQLQALHVQGYQVASELISSPDEVACGPDLVRETVAALNAERTGSGAVMPTKDDPVVVFAYGLGAWPAGADLTSLEGLLTELGVSQPALRSRFESLLRIIPTANQNREFRELAGASFVLGAAARILEAAVPPSRSLPPPGWFATLKRRLQ
jgi:hypothetical protein